MTKNGWDMIKEYISIEGYIADEDWMVVGCKYQNNSYIGCHDEMDGGPEIRKNQRFQ